MSTNCKIPPNCNIPQGPRPPRARSAIREQILTLASRGGCDYHQVDALLEDWVHALMADAMAEYERMFQAHWPERGDEKLVPGEFREYVGNWMNGARSPHRSVRTPNWPWPITEITPTRRSGMPAFERDMSALKVCGYSVGKSSDMTQGGRRQFLVYFFTHELPRQVRDEFGDEYGAPGSEYRLRKMANVMASACRNAKRRRDGADFEVAISDWEADLAFLKAEFYDRFRAFEWPSALVW
jgi:hypothetical protein